MRDYVTFASTNVRPEKNRGKLDRAMWTRSEGTTVQMCRDSTVAERWINGYCDMGRSTEIRLAEPRRQCIHGGKLEWRTCTEIGDRRTHIFREHNHEADYIVNLGAEGVSKVTAETVKNTETWKALQGYLDGNKKANGNR